MNFKFNVKLMKCPIKQKQTKQNKKKKALVYHFPENKNYAYAKANCALGYPP